MTRRRIKKEIKKKVNADKVRKKIYGRKEAS